MAVLSWIVSLMILTCVSSQIFFSNSENGIDYAEESSKDQPALYSDRKIPYAVESRQANTTTSVTQQPSRIPCSCSKGVCRCCTSMPFLASLNGCIEVIYMPEDFAFNLRMRVNNRVFFQQRVSGKNPPPFCFRPLRFGFARACIRFHDVYFFGRNMHVCMDINGYFQGYELFERSYDCLQLGMNGVKIVKPGEESPLRPIYGEIDQGDDDIEDYDENVVRHA